MCQPPASALKLVFGFGLSVSFCMQTPESIESHWSSLLTAYGYALACSILACRSHLYSSGHAASSSSCSSGLGSFAFCAHLRLPTS